MKRDQVAQKKNRGRPKGSLKKIKEPLSTKGTTTTTRTDNDAGKIICIGSSLGRAKSIDSVKSFSDTNDVSKCNSLGRKNVTTGSVDDMKEARVILENIIYSNLISPEQLKKLLNKRHSSPDFSFKSMTTKQKKIQSKASSVSSDSEDSDIIYMDMTKCKFDPKFKVEPLDETPKVKTCRPGRSSKMSVEQQSLNETPPSHQSIFPRQCRTRNEGSIDNPICIRSSSSDEHLESIEPKKESKGTKRNRSDTSFEEFISHKEVLREESSRYSFKASKRRKKNDSDAEMELVKVLKFGNFNKIDEVGSPIKKTQDSDSTNFTSMTSKNVPSTFRTVENPKSLNITNSEIHCDAFCSYGNDSFKSKTFRVGPPVLSPKIVVSSTTLPHTNLKICANDRLPLTPFASSGTEVTLDVDEKHCCLDSIARAIENDLASGNRLSPITDCLENIEIPADLPTDTCCLSKMIINGPTAPNNLNRVEEDKEQLKEVHKRGSENHETSSNTLVSNASSETTRKRKRLAIVKDDIFPKGTFHVSSKLTVEEDNGRMSGPTVVAESMYNKNSAENENNVECNISYQSDVRLSNAVYTWTKLPEIAALLKDDTTNTRLSVKSDCVIGSEDALNNNQEDNFVNKNTVNSEKQEEKLTLCSSLSTASLDFMMEFNALNGLLTTLGETGVNEHKSIAEVKDCLEPESDDREIDEAIELFTASVISHSSNKKNIENKEEHKSLIPLTVHNVDKVDCVAIDSTTATQKKSPARWLTSDTDSWREVQSEDSTLSSSVSTNPRKRKWVPSDNITSPKAQKQKIRLVRGNWGNKINKQFDVSSAAGEGSAQSKNCRVTSKASAEEPKTNDVKIDYPQRLIAQTVTNNNFRKPSSLTKGVVERDDDVGTAVPGFGVEAIDGGAKSQSAKDAEADESSTSSNSGSSSSSSSSSDSNSSSCSTSSESSDDESQSENVPTRMEIPKNSCPFIYGIKSPTEETHEIMKKDKAQRDSETVDEYGKAAGSFIENCVDTEESVDEDEDDCISLFTESLCMSRSGSPTFHESPKRKSSPLYRRMKSENIGPFVNANKRECDAVFEAYRDNDRVNNDKINNEKMIIELPPVKDPLPQLEQINEILINPITQTEAQEDLRSTLNNMCTRDMQFLFRGQCFAWLKNGVCNNQLSCRYKHVLKPQLQQIHLFNMKNIEGILKFAIGNRYRYFIEIVQTKAVSKMSAEQILAFYNQLYRARLLTDLNIENAADVLTKRGFSLKDIVSSLDGLLLEGDEDTPKGIIRVLYKKIELGSYWKILRKVISKVVPPPWLVERVIEECIIEKKSKEHVIDVYENLIKNFPTNLSSIIRGNLLTEFANLLNTNDSVNANVNTVETHTKFMENNEKSYTIASPDSSRVSTPISELSVEVDNPMTVLTVNPTVLNSHGYELVRKSSMSSSGSASRTLTESQNNNYCMTPIDNLPSAKSPYRDVLWKFHWDLQGIQEGLKHKDYTHVEGILTQNINHPSRLPHMKGFYNILCKEIMSSKHHLAAIVRLTVLSGASNILRQFIFDLGVHVLTKLADIGSWVLAYQLLKTFQVYGTYNTCGYTLLAAEIYIANYRPLKALALLKQSQLVFTNTRIWNQLRSPNDEPLRVKVMDLLLSSLCDGYAQHALSLLEFILGDQCSTFKPINVSRHIDTIALVLMSEKHTGSIIDLGRLIIQAHLSVSRSTFRALINGIFHSDRFLAKQLHRYATWLGVYTTAKISRTTHMIVNNDWTEEEMYLMFSSLIDDLSTNIGHAIDRLRPRQLTVFLMLESVPSERHLRLNICDGPTNNVAINKRKDIVRGVLERFDPKIKLVGRYQGRLCKLQSASLVQYLKAGHSEHIK